MQAHPNEKLNTLIEFLLSKIHELPILSDTFKAIEILNQNSEDETDVNQLSSLILNDPFFTLKILIKLSTRQKTGLTLDVNSLRKAIMILGTQQVFNLALNSSVAISHNGLKIAVNRARYAAEIAQHLSFEHHDILPEEIQLSTLLADLGELILWIFKPDLPHYVRESMIHKQFDRNQAAQLSLCGFKFKDLSLILAKRLYLPESIIDLIGTSTKNRAKISKACVDISRHLNENDGHFAIPDDLVHLSSLIGQPTSKLISSLHLSLHLTPEQLSYVQKICH